MLPDSPHPVLILAPLKGFTDHVFRTVYAEHFNGFDRAVAPFIASRRDMRRKRSYVKDVLDENNPLLPVEPQIIGKSADEFAVLADFLFMLGHESVNWNLGCPWPMVANKGRGAGMLPDTDGIDRFLDTALSRLKCRLSIKLRLGWKGPEDLFRLIPVFNRYPLSEITIHPRTAVQRYAGEIDLAAFERCVTELNAPVVYNGDIRTVDDFERLSQRFPGVSGWMIGRGCLYDPFLAPAIRGETVGLEHRIGRWKAFHEALYHAYGETMSGPSHLLDKMKGFWRHFCHPFEDDCKKSLKNIKKAVRPEQYLDLVNRFYDEEAPGLLKG